jgi:hypothetical protein
MDIPKSLLKKLKLRKESELVQEEKDIQELRAIENTKTFKASMEVVDKIGKEIGEMREWAPYCSDAKTYFPFPIDILKLTKEQLLQQLVHCYGTAQYLKNRLDEQR